MDSNIKINKEDGSVLISVNPEIYPLAVIYSAAYVFTEKAYIILDGNPHEEVLVQIKAKNKKDNPKTLADEFGNELLNYAVYKSQSEKNKEIRKAILQRVLLTNIKVKPQKDDFQNIKEDDYKKDPEGILKPFKEQ